jgi:hypothetical protein
MTLRSTATGGSARAAAEATESRHDAAPPSPLRRGSPIGRRPTTGELYPLSGLDRHW